MESFPSGPCNWIQIQLQPRTSRFSGIGLVRSSAGRRFVSKSRPMLSAKSQLGLVLIMRAATQRNIREPVFPAASPGQLMRKLQGRLAPALPTLPGSIAAAPRIARPDRAPNRRGDVTGRISSLRRCAVRPTAGAIASRLPASCETLTPASAAAGPGTGIPSAHSIHTKQS